MLKFRKSTKSTESTKSTKSKKVMTQTKKAEIYKYDVIFDLEYLSKLFNSNDFMLNVPNYLNKFFFKYGSDVFYDNSKTFVLLSREEAKN